VDTHIPGPTSGRPPARSRGRPARSGPVPPLADCFSPRPDTGHDLTALSRGEIVVLAPPPGPPGLADGAQAGTGKTELAAFAAESLWQSKVIDLLVWVPAYSRDSILTAFAQASAAAGLDPAGDTRRTAVRYLDWLSTSRRPWLVILDDLADAADLGGLWPEGPAGRVLVTTEKPACLADARSADLLQVGGFSPREAMSYLMARLARDRDQRIGAADLIEDLGCMPLALAQASAVIMASGQTCREYAERFARRRAQMLTATRTEPSAAAVTWTLSLENADRIPPAGLAQQVLAQAALLDCHGIPGAVLTSAQAAGDGDGGPGALASLERAGLLTINRGGSGSTVLLNPAVKAEVQQAMPTPMREQAAEQAAAGLLRAWPEQDDDPWLALALRSCAASLSRAAEVSLWGAGGYPVLFRAGRSLVSAGHAGLAVEHWHELAVTSEGVLGPGDPSSRTAQEELAGALVAADRADEAISLYEGIADERARTHGPDHPDTLKARASLARALIAAGRGGDAMTLFERIVAASDQLAGPEHPDTLTVLDGLAAACLAAGRFGEATQLMEHTLAIRERSGWLRHPDTLAARMKLAQAYCAAGQPKAAVSHYQRVVAFRERDLGPGHPDTAAARDGLAAARQQAWQRRLGRGREQ
jgi:tetratricopeptide (TPR) repeat protein